jgi:endonuclease/exonuclease/phosphatase family metal-dependent hydrolase
VTELRVMSYNLSGRRDLDAVAAVVRAERPDVVLAQGAPRRLRWRTRCAELARRCGLLYAEGGLPGLGNLVLVDLRVRVLDTWCLRYPLVPGRLMRGAALARCSVGGSTFVVAGTALAPEAAERSVQATLLAKALAERSEPVVLGAEVNEGPDGPAWTILAEGRTTAGGTDGSAILVDPRVRVSAARVLDSGPVVVDLDLP